ncbi:glycoside hydrolase family 16 protein [Nocardioides jensenii]|uniref:glycoside hydrolase family 16 protein n=1 Tax=Nocardioides jensenii TaxID=1843 RepID=UPI0008303A09|nr:glycoside hydrolase family 16 protein [Nocardioides jensenii]
MSRIRTAAALVALSLGLFGASYGATVGTASAAPEERAAQRTTAWHLHFKDDFKGTRLTSYWSHKNTPASHRDTCRYTSPYAHDRSRNRSNNSVVKVHDGRLHLLVRKQVCPNGRVLWKSGAITTYSTMHMESALTWRITAKIKFPRSSGNHAALWSLAVNNAMPTGPQELDMAESFGWKSRAGNCNGHTWLNYYWIYTDPAAQVKQCMKKSPTPWSGFHTYKVLWKGGQYARVYIDGVKRGELLGAAVPNTPEYLLLTNLVNDGHGKNIGRIDSSTTMIVESIKTEWR